MKLPLKPLLDAATLLLQRNPASLRVGLGLARRVLPSRLRRQLITSHAAVTETFARADELRMGQLNAPKLKLGPFVLGMDPPDERYAFEKQALSAALVAAPVLAARFARADAEHVAQLLAARGRAGALELGATYAQSIYARALGHAFGVPARGEPCPAFGPQQDDEPLSQYIKVLGGTIGSDHPAPFGLEGRALAVAPYFREHLIAALAAHRTGRIQALLPRHELAPAPSAGETVLGQLLATHPFRDGDEGIVRNVAGLLCASASFPYVWSSVLHELLQRPAHMRCFLQAVRDEDEPRVLAHVREALRFRPPFPMLVRFCPHHARLASSGAELRSGERLALFPASAMFDIEDAAAFDATRAESSYFVFGGAPRECLGKDLISSLFLPLFRGLALHLPEVFEARPGRFRFDGPTLGRYTLELPARSTYARDTHAPVLRPRSEPQAVYALEPGPELADILQPSAADDSALSSDGPLELRRSRLPEPVQ